MDTDLVLIGEIISPHGHHGEVKIKLYYYDDRRLEEVTHLYVAPSEESPTERKKISGIRYLKNGPVIRFDGINDINGAERIQHHFLLVPESQMVSLKQDEYFWHDLIELHVVDELENEYGVVKSIVETGSNDILIITGKQGEVLVPFIKSVILHVDKHKNRLIINPLPGLFDDED